MNVSPVSMGVASWITPAHLQQLQAHGLTLGKIAKNIAAFEIFDSYSKAMQQRLDGEAVQITADKPPMQMYTAGRKGKSNLELLIQDCFAAQDLLAIG